MPPGAAQALEDRIVEIGPDRVMAFVAETVVGATLGAVPAVGDYFKRIRAICDRYGVLLILDEVMCGMGRTGTLHACEQEGVAPDLMALAKGLGGGYQPIGAVMLSKRIYEAFANGSGAFQHGHTYMGHPMAAAAALAVQDVIRRDRLLANVVEMGARLERRLNERFAQHPFVGDIRGRGLFWALELVSDRASKRPFDPALKLHARVKREAMAQGLMVYPMGGAVDGVEGDHILLAPPFIVEPVRGRHDRRAPRRLARGCSRRRRIAAQRPRARHRKSAVLAESRRFRRDGIFPIIPPGERRFGAPIDSCERI